MQSLGHIARIHSTLLSLVSMGQSNVSTCDYHKSFPNIRRYIILKGLSTGMLSCSAPASHLQGFAKLCQL